MTSEPEAVIPVEAARRESHVASVQPLVPLGAALVGLLVQYFVWRGWMFPLLRGPGHHYTMLTFTLVIRALPIALVLLCMAGATSAGAALGGRLMARRARDGAKNGEDFPLMAKTMPALESKFFPCSSSPPVF